MLFCRVNYPRMYDVMAGCEAENVVEVARSGCWINIITAGGLLLIPEAGSSCSCDFPIHPTMALVLRCRKGVASLIITSLANDHGREEPGKR